MNNTYTADFKSLVTRYWGGVVFLGMIVLFAIFRPLIDARITYEDFFNPFLSKDLVLTIYFGLFILFFHFSCYFIAYDYTKKLIISDKSVIFYLFELFSSKKLEFKYSDIDLVENDKHPTIFVFTLDSGKKKEIHATVKNREEALKIIQNKISNFKNNQK